MTYDNSDGKRGYDFNQNGNIVTSEAEIVIDKLAGIKPSFPHETKVILRIAYHVYLKMKREGVI